MCAFERSEKGMKFNKEMELQGYDNNAIQKLTGLSIKEIEDL